VALIVIISVFASRKEEAEVTTVKLEVKPELRQTVTARRVRPIRYIKLTSEVPGRIEEIYVNAGDQVVQGKPLVASTHSTSVEPGSAIAATQASLNDIQARQCCRLRPAGPDVAESSVASARQQLVPANCGGSRPGRSEYCAKRTQTQQRSDRAGVASRAEYDAARDRFDQAKLQYRPPGQTWNLSEWRKRGDGTIQPTEDCRPGSKNRYQVI